MGESWMGLWVFTLIGVFIIAVTIYDYFDRKKRAQEIKAWKYCLPMAAGMVMAGPAVFMGLLWLLGFSI